MICGIDEAGRGPVIGPLVVVGVMVEDESELERLNVRDSKKCTPERRERLAKEIKSISELEVIILEAEEIDELRASKTLNEIEVELYAEIIRSLEPEVAFVDAVDVDDARFGIEIRERLDFDVEIVSKHGADNIYAVVSAASIIAKTIRDERIKSIERELGESIGSGYPSDSVTVNFLEKWIKEKGNLPPHTRKSWKTVRALLSRAKTLKNFSE